MIGITKSEFENSLFRQDVVEYYLNMSIEDIRYKFGDIILNIVDYETNDAHHCYDVFEHTLLTVRDIPYGELSREELLLLKIAAFLHDVSKPTLQEGQRNNIESSKMAENFLIELGYSLEEIKRICFYIEHINDFVHYKDEVPYYYEHSAVIRKISALSISEKMIENAYDFKSCGIDELQTKALCYYLVRDEEWPLYEDVKGNEVYIEPLNIPKAINKVLDSKRDFIPTLKDYKMLVKLSISNYKAQAKRTFRRGKLVATRAEKVRVAAIIEAILPEAYKIYKAAVERYQVDSELTHALVDITNEYNELVAMNQVEQMREDNAKNLMNKFNDMKIRLTMKS